MNHHRLLFLLGSLLTSAPASAALVQTFQQTGNLGLEFAGAPGQGNLFVTGSLNLTNMPVTASSIVRATLYVDQTNNGIGLDANFGGTPLNGGNTVSPFASDSALITTLFSYQWDVTSLIIPGINSYNFTVGQNTLVGSNIAGIGLSVVWSDPTAPLSTVTLFEGMQQIGESGPETESITFTNLPAGSTDAWLFTVHDDSTNSGETVSYNNNTIGNNIDQNLGNNASILNYTATSTAGNNTLSIATGQDHMGWVAAGTLVTVGTVDTIPESTTPLLISMLMLAMILFRCRKNRSLPLSTQPSSA